MTRKIISTCILILFLYTQANAQIPGYMGKRFSLTANAGLCLSNTNAIPISIKPTLGIEYVIGRNWSLAFTADINKRDVEVNISRPSDMFIFTLSEPAVYPLQISTFALSFKKYSGSMLAPLGPYWGIGLSYSHLSTGEISKDAMLANSYSRLGLQCILGRNYIINDIFVFNIGIKYAVTFCNPIPSLDSYDTQGLPKANEQKLNSALWISNIITLEAGIGILLF